MPEPEQRPLSPAAKALDAALTGNRSLVAQLVSQGVHRTMLWRFRTGRSKPSVDTAAVLERETCGRVRASEWTEPSTESAA